MVYGKKFRLLSKTYGPIVSKLIDDNQRFYWFGETIKWCFKYNDDVSIVATCDRKTNIIHVNLCSFMKEYFEKDLRVIEYFLLHEIRHVFQHLVIKDYKDGNEVSIEKTIVKKWIYENEHYIKSKKDDGSVNPDYFFQNSEIDAYSFSYAVMKYKNKNSGLYIPEYNTKQFWELVEEWLEYFKENKI